MADDDEFTKGMEVEVCSNESGLRGAWFVATVLRGKSKKNKVLIEYHTLLASEKGTKPLREFIDYVNVRPPPPREIGRSFQVNEEVDANHNDGWWEGVITRINDGERYVVYFRPAKEEIVFGKEDLRLHREWRNGSWVPPLEDQQQQQQQNNKEEDLEKPEGQEKQQQNQQKEGDQQKEQKQSTPQRRQRKGNQQQEKSQQQPKKEDQQQHQQEKTERQKQQKNTPVLEIDKNENSSKLPVQFNEGIPVEVSSDDDGFVGAWFTATIIKPVGENKYLIEYHNLRTDDETALLREEVDALHIRPHPPALPQVDCFSRLEEVDAFYNDGWWVGVISKVISGQKYFVYFKESKEELEFGYSDLRLHQDWIGGKWVRPSQALQL